MRSRGPIGGGNIAVVLDGMGKQGQPIFCELAFLYVNAVHSCVVVNVPCCTRGPQDV